MFTFNKIERLCSKRDIGLIFSNGKHKTSFPLKLYWRQNEFTSPFPARIVIVVPKRAFKKAVDRNRIKRQIREVYRLNKELLYSKLIAENKKMDLYVLFIGNSFVKNEDIKKALLTLFKEIQ